MGAEEAPADPPDRSDRLAALLRELTARVAELEAATGTGPAVAFSDEKLAAIATAFYRARQRRAAYFDAELFAEPAWDMLLDLFVNSVRGVRVPTTSLCLAANVSHATGTRWIGQLQAAGLLLRKKEFLDRRYNLVEMTPLGFRLMRQYLTDTIRRLPALDA